MTNLNLAGKEIYICSRAEAKEIWKNEPGKRSQIWLEDEFIRSVPLDTLEVMAIIRQKEKQPGYTYLKPVAA